MLAQRKDAVKLANARMAAARNGLGWLHYPTSPRTSRPASAVARPDSAAAMPNAKVMECPASANRFKSDLADLSPGATRVQDGAVAVPQGPGLGLEVNWDAVAEMEGLAREVAA